MLSFRFWMSRFILEIFAMKVWRCANCFKFCMFLASNFFREGPEFLAFSIKLTQTPITELCKTDPNFAEGKFLGDCPRIFGLLLNSISNCFRDIALYAYWGRVWPFGVTWRHQSRDVISHVTIWFPVGHFLLVVRWNQASISNGFRDIQRWM